MTPDAQFTLAIVLMMAICAGNMVYDYRRIR
jgi:hypothetical protein